MSRSLQKGQALLVIVLIAVVVMTVGLSIATRTITNLRTTTEEENSQQAFSAAEAGIQRALKGENSGQTSVNQTTKYTFTKSPQSGDSLILNNSAPVLKDDGVDIWLSEYDGQSNGAYNANEGDGVGPDYTDPWPLSGTQTLRVYYTEGGTCDVSPNPNPKPAIEFILVKAPANNPVITRYAYDSCDTGRNTQNKFSAPDAGGTVLGKSFDKSFSVTLNAGEGILARVVPLYNNSTIAVVASSTLPAQGENIESIGTSGDTQRKITVFRGYPKIPNEFFSYVLLSP